MAQSVFLDLDQGYSPSASIIPAADNTYDLGSATFQWRSIYLGTSLVVGNSGTFGYTDAFWSREGAGYLIEKNSTTAQRLSVANTYTSASNNELFLSLIHI